MHYTGLNFGIDTNCFAYVQAFHKIVLRIFICGVTLTRDAIRNEDLSRIAITSDT